MFARHALATPVTASVSPGPAVTTATPGWPVTRAQPSAACPAVCSWRVSTTRMPLIETAVVDRHHVPAAEREDVRDALGLESAGDDAAAVQLAHVYSPITRRIAALILPAICEWQGNGAAKPARAAERMRLGTLATRRRAHAVADVRATRRRVSATRYAATTPGR